MITDVELAKLRATQELTMGSTCTVLRATRSSDGAGGFSEEWGVVATLICRVGAASISERVASERESVTGPLRVTVPAESDVRTGDRLALSTGDIVDVGGFQVPETFETARVLTCSRVKDL